MTSMLLSSALPGDPSGLGDVVMPVGVQGSSNALAASSQCGLQLVPIAPLAPLQMSTAPPTAIALATDALALRGLDPTISGQTADARPSLVHLSQDIWSSRFDESQAFSSL